MDLVSLERACELAVGGGGTAAERTAAQQRVVALGTDVANISVIQSLLDNSVNNFAIVVAAQSLLRLVTDHWNSFSEPQHVDIRNYILTFLATKGPSLQPFAITAVVQLLCRITKYAWFDTEGAAIRDVVTETKKFLQATIGHCVIGMRILNELVTEMNVKNRNRTLTQQRKVAVSFRDTALLQAFEVSLSMLNQIATRSIQLDSIAPQEAARVEDALLEQATSLLNGCLSFDFIGTNPDESSEDIGVIQVPSAWRDRIQTGASLRLLFNVYKGCTTGRIPLIPDAAAPPITPLTDADAQRRSGRGNQEGGTGSAAAASSLSTGPTRPFPTSASRARQALEALCLLVSVRRTLFASDLERRRFLGHILRGVVDILREEQGLSDEDCYHSFARLLSRIKTNFQLVELMRTEGYAEWVDAVAHFTIASCAKPTWSSNSLHYVLGLWSRLIASVPYVRLEAVNSNTGGSAAVGAPMPELLLDAYIPKIVSAYVRGRVDSLIGQHAEQALTELDDLEALEDQLEQLPGICRFAYEPVAAAIIAIMDPLLARYAEGIAYLRAPPPGANADSVLTAVRVTECQLAWLVAIIGAILSGASQPTVGYYIPSAIAMANVGGASASTSASGGSAVGATGDETWDADLSRRVLTLMAQVDMRVSAAAAGLAPSAAAASAHVRMVRTDARLELAFVYFMSAFRKAYINEQSGMPPPESSSAAATSSRNTAVVSMFSSGVAMGGALGSSAQSGSGGDSNMATTGVGGGAAGAAGQSSIMSNSLASGVAGGAPNSSSTLAELHAAATGRQKAFLSMFLRMGLGDHLVVVTTMLQKAASNLRYWVDRDDIIRRTLDVLHDLVYSYTSGRLLLGLDTVSSLLQHHSAEYFPFLALPAHSRYRTTFYTALARLVFMEDESDVRAASRVRGVLAPSPSHMIRSHKLPLSSCTTDAFAPLPAFSRTSLQRFDPFIAPLLAVLDKLGPAVSAGLRNEEVMRTLIGACRDWRGVLLAAHNRPTYMLVFDSLFPRHVPTLTRAIEVWSDTPSVVNVLLKLVAELVFNRSMRVSFGNCSANGILLFREASAIGTAYGRRIANFSPPFGSDPYPSKFKGVTELIRIANRSLDGGYVNFGVFALYGDRALQDLVDCVLNVTLAAQPSEILSFPKLGLQYMSFLHLTFRSHLELVVALQQAAFLRILSTLKDGIDSLDGEVAQQAAGALDHLASNYVRLSKQPTRASSSSPGGDGSAAGNVAATLRAHIAASPTVFETLMKILFHILIFGEAANQWALARPLLPLILAAELVRPDCFEAFKAELLHGQPSDLQPRMSEELGRLMRDITRGLDVVNRDRFAQKLTVFRLAVKEFATS